MRQSENRAMKAFFMKLNYLPVFDPSLWPFRELIARGTGLFICMAFIIHRLVRFSRYTGEMPSSFSTFPDIRLGASEWHWIMWCIVWVLETGIFTGYILAFLTRNEAKSVAKGFMEVVFPVGVAALPVLITLAPMNFRSVWPPVLERAEAWLAGSMFSWLAPMFDSWEKAFFLFLFLVILGGAINLVGLFTLRKAFTIMSEARMLIRRGIFSSVRHPLYAGHFVMFFGYLMFHLYWYTCILYALFLAGQYFRARIEEGKLTGIFPEYAAYRERTGMFFPKIFA